ncbi:uncharacterized protein V1516DRAFT_700734 [Lipomyces oligophaga]|uniref:uncharacterized protein n=1 Tax=Lipomyces oligophaga TaxID=45792 RepID=UPI0034D006D6
MSIQFDDFEVILTEADREALSGEDVNSLSIPKDWPELSEPYIDCVATRQSIFDDPVKSEALGLNELYNELPPFDVQARWSLREEHLLMQKVYFKVFSILLFSLFSFCSDSKGLPPLAISFLCTDLDISEQSRKIIFLITFLFFYIGLILSNVLSIKSIPRQLPSALLFAAGLALVAQYWITNVTELYVTQAIISLGSTVFAIFILRIRPFLTFHDLKLIGFLYLPTSALVDLLYNLLGYSVISLGKAGDRARWRDVSLVYASSYEILRKRFTSRELTIMVNRVLLDNPFYDSSPTRLMKPKFVKTAKYMFFSLHALC